MPSAAALRTFLRTTTSTLRPAATSQVPRSFSQFQSQPQSQTRSSSPPPPPPYQVRNHSLLASTTHWTRFTTPYTHSSVRTFTRSTPTPTKNTTTTTSSSSPTSPTQAPSTSPTAAQKIDQAIETIQDLYGTARDEFEIAAEETEKNTTYAADDRAAAREELDKLLAVYEGIVEGGDRAVAEEVKRRVGQRVRELEQAVLGLEESVKGGD
ncbi:hypothetical protein CC80DRAFT_497126 [Byssothecium circinans]|uniref:Uncharacterized protein n=1 Tax=Byssothecium circinans TaxID=147558 RepID=A0A6A5TCA1_9PLEO|nr:hypothetical protein CC80DRAFT_497126 [Byssothecium circinans]